MLGTSKQKNKQDGAVPGTAPPSFDALKKIFRTVASVGSLCWGRSFRTRIEIYQGGPGFNMIDAVRVLRRGSVVLGPQFDYFQNAWHYEVEDSVEGKTFVLDVLLHCDSDFQDSPRITVRSGFFRRGRRREKMEKTSKDHGATTDGDERKQR